MNDRIKAKTTISLFLAFILIAGTTTSLLPSSAFITNVQAQPYYYDDGMNDNNNNYYESPEYPSYKPDYKAKYSSDNNNYKSKDSSKSVSINKIKCINTNLNINGNNAGNVSIGNKGQEVAAGEGYYDGHNKKNKGIECIISNNNNNINIVAGGRNVTDSGGNQTIPPETLTATLNVSKVLECVPFQTLPNYLEACDRILTEITPNQFNFAVIGNNSNPSQFDGSSVGINVKMGPGNYVVSETIDQSVSTTLTDISNDLGVVIQQDLNVGFSRDCDEIVVGGVEVGVGTIAEGESQECRVFNEFLVGIENE